MLRLAPFWVATLIAGGLVAGTVPMSTVPTSTVAERAAVPIEADAQLGPLSGDHALTGEEDADSETDDLFLRRRRVSREPHSHPRTLEFFEAPPARVQGAVASHAPRGPPSV